MAGFLSADNQKYLAEEEDIHVCQGTIWSQYAIDNQDGDGSISYPYYPSTEHFCKPAQGKADFIDCVTLDGWSMDYLAARRQGFAEGFNSRMGVGPIETLRKYGPEIGLQEMMHTTAINFDAGFELNGFAWVTNIWELCLDIDHQGLTDWLASIRNRWPDVKFVTQGEFGSIWRKAYKENSFDYRFVEQGSGIGGSDKDKEIRWYMNKDFRLATLRNIEIKDAPVYVIDFTRYDIPAQEPQGIPSPEKPIRNWSLMNVMNQKGLRPQDKPKLLKELSAEDQALIKKHYPELF